MKDYLTDAELIWLLRQAANDAGSASAWAREHDFGRAFICDVLAGRRDMTERLARALGYQPARFWQQKKKN